MTTSAATQASPEASATHSSLVVYNTLTRKKEPFTPVTAGKVGIYLCGPTVYAEAHIGHMVGPVIFDCIKRFLVYNGYDVTWVVNITDVDDKLITKANERGMTMLEVADENIADYHRNLAALGVDQIDEFPRATDCMEEIVQFIADLIERGFAYESAGDVYFDVSKDSEYGKLSNRSLDSMMGEGGGTADRKRNASDFALWKSAKQGEPSWDSPWGNGRPGWHIECSAMSKKLLGETFDIHGGGLDLEFPHHENEIAQSECCHGKPMVRYWCHNGLLKRDAAAGKIGGKMSRSEGAGGLADLLARQGGERIRFFLLRTHYRSTVLFSEPAIEEAAIGLESFYRLFKRYTRITSSEFQAISAPSRRGATSVTVGNDPALTAAAKCRGKFLASMDDDFNTGGAIAELFELARIVNKFCDDHDLEGAGRGNAANIAILTLLIEVLRELSSLLGLFTAPQAESASSDNLASEVMSVVIELRSEARAAKKFGIADVIRDGLNKLNVTLEDRAGGTEWTGGGENLTDELMRMLIDIRASARSSKDFATGDAVRDKLKAIGITLEDRAGGTEWTNLS